MSALLGLGPLMREMYELAHPPDSRVAKRETRRLAVGGPVDFEVFLSGMRRQQYEADNLAYEAAGRTNCRLCWQQESLLYRNELAIAPDSHPFFPYHMLLRPVRPQQIDPTFEVVGRQVKRGSVGRQQLDCRPDFSFEDIVSLCRLVQAAPDYMVTQSMRGSGASIPEHIHAHAFLKTQTDFPLLNRACFVRLEGARDVWVNRHVTYGLLVKGAPEPIARLFVALREQGGFHSNHYLKVDDAFGGSIGLYVPRVRQVPPFPRFVDWKFGAFEVLGLYDVKTPELYRTLTADEACAATRSVTLQDRRSQAVLEDVCRAVFPEQAV
jgi:hypothetical protein